MVYVGACCLKIVFLAESKPSCLRHSSVERKRANFPSDGLDIILIFSVI